MDNSINNLIFDFLDIIKKKRIQYLYILSNYQCITVFRRDLSKRASVALTAPIIMIVKIKPAIKTNLNLMLSLIKHNAVFI